MSDSEPGYRRGNHAEQRSNVGRPVSTAFADVQRASRSDIFVQMDIIQQRDELLDLSADLVAMRSHEDFLQRLFRQESGTWTKLSLLCRGLPHLEQRLHRLQAEVVTSLFVTWLAHPESNTDESYCTIVFFSTDLLWSNIVVYNRHRLLASINHHQVNGRP